jgi:magnesium chelatase family protein
MSSLAIVHSRGLAGASAPPVSVEVHLANGLPAFQIVGLAETEVREARERVRAALQNSGFEFPARRITVNLAPADLPKESGRFDLPIAVGILAACGVVPLASLAAHEFAGELSLNGELRPVRGALAMTFGAAAQARSFVLPRESAPEAALATNATVLGVRDLLELCAHLNGHAPLARVQPVRPAVTTRHPDLADVKGQAFARRALEVAAAGGHALLLVGPPGTGKSMLAQRLPGILPPLHDPDALEAAAIQSLGSRGFDPATWAQPAFRAPHHTASSAAMIGGGSGNPRPGEVSLAHRGVLFLDEMPEFDRRVLEVLREPIESGRVAIARAARQAEFPARFQLVGAMNPCPCGYLGHASGRCRCTPEAVDRYRARLSGPLLDRIDLHVEVPALPDDDLIDAPPGEPSDLVRTRVCAARARQLERQGRMNADLAPADIDRVCALDTQAEAFLRRSLARLHLSARGYHRILKVARTLADMAARESIETTDLAQAVQYRRLAAPVASTAVA